MSDSEVILEKGVCRIVFESTDKEDDYCLDIDAESEIDQSEASSCEEDKIEIECGNSQTKYYWKEFNKRKHSVPKRIIENSSESECEDAKKRSKPSTFEQYDETEEAPPLQNVPDLSSMLQAELSNMLENDNNTIRKSFSHQYQNDSFENFETRVPEIQNISIIDSQSFMEMTDAVRRLTEVLVLPINQIEVKEMHFANQKESDALEREKILETISMTERGLRDNTDSSINPCASSLLCFDNANNSLRPYRDEKQNHSIDLGNNCCQPNATFEAYNWPLYECTENVVPQIKENKEFEFDYGMDDTIDFNMAVEALNLLKNKGRVYSNSLNGYPQTLETISATSSGVSNVAEKSSPIDSTIEIPPIDNCSSTEKKRLPLFDSTLQITDCATGAIIPIESIFQNNEFLTANENEFSILNEGQNEMGIDKCIIQSTLTQLSDTVTCVIVSSCKSILSDCDQESENKVEDYRYASTHQDELGQTNATVLVDKSLENLKRCSSFLPEITIRKKNKFKDTSLSQHRSQKSTNNGDEELDIQQKNESPNTSLFSSNNKVKGLENHFKAPPEVVTNNKSHEPTIKIKKCNDQLEEMSQNNKKRRCSQTSKISDCSLEQTFEISSPTVFENDTKYPNGYKKCANKRNKLLQAFLSTSAVLKSALNQSLENPTNEQEDKPENGYFENFQNCFIASKQELEEEQQFNLSEKKQENFVDFKETKDPLCAFNLTINDSMIKRIVKYTNKTLLESSANVKIAIYKKTTNEIELKAFIGLLLIAAALKQNNVKISELWSECFGASIYRATLQEGRFQILLSKVSFGDTRTTTVQTNKTDAFQIGDPWEEYLDNCKKYPMPKTNVKAQKNPKNEYYTTVRKTKNLSLSVLLSMLDSAIFRGLAIFQKENPQSRMCIRTFFQHIGMALVKPHLETKLLRPTISNFMREFLENILSKKCTTSKSVLHPGVDKPLKKQKRCQLCSWNKDRKTRHKCISCRRNMCKEHRSQLCVQCVDSI